MTRAADRRLQEAKDLLAQMKAEQANLQAIPAEEPAKDLPTEPETTPVFGDGELAEIVEGIQIGDAEEGAAATQKLIEKVMEASRQNQPASPDVDVDTAVRNQVFQVRQQEQVNGAIRRFSESNKDIVDDPQATQIMRMTVVDNMRKDLRSLGFSDEQVASVGDNVDLLAAAHGFHNMQGRLRSYDDVLAESAMTVRTIYAPLAQPAPSLDKEVVTQRNAEKEKLQQPKHGTTRSAPPSKPRPKSRAEIVQSYRKQRNYK